MPNKFSIPLRFDRGLLQSDEPSVLPEGHVPVCQNYVPRPTGGFRARRGWLNGSVSGAPATRRTRGIGTVAVEASSQTPARRQTITGSAIGNVAPSWAQATATGSTLLAGITAKRRVRIVQAPALSSSSTTSVSNTWAQATVNGNCLIAVVFVAALGTMPTITPPAGWTSRAAVTIDPFGGGEMERLEIFVRENSAVRSGTETFTFNVDCLGSQLGLYEYEGVATATAFDQSATASGTGTTTASTGTTGATTQRDELLFCSLVSDKGFSGNPTGGFSIVNQITGMMVADQVVEQTGAANCTRTISATPDYWLGAVITLKAALTGPPAITPPSGWASLVSVTRNQVRTTLYAIQNANSRSGVESFAVSVVSNTEIVLAEYTGVSAASLDASATNSGASTTASSGTTGATTQASEIAVAFLQASATAQSAPTNSFSTVAYIAERFTMYEKVLSATGTQSVAATLAATRDWTGVIATFKANVQTITGGFFLVADDDGTNFDIWSINRDALPSGTWSLIDGNVPATSLERQYPVRFTAGLGLILYTHKDFNATRSWNGTVAAAVGAAPRGRAMAFYRNRFFIGGTKSGAFGSNAQTSNSSRLWYSNLGSATAWGNLDFIDVNQDDREPIEDIAAVSDGLLIAKRNSLWFLSGTGPDNFELHRLDQGTGHPGRCIAVSGYGAIIAGTHHVWLWRGGDVEKISGPIEESYNLGGMFVSADCVGETIYICDSGPGLMHVYDMAREVWWTEDVEAPGTECSAIIFAHEERLLYGPHTATVIGPLAYRDLTSGPRQRDIALSEMLKAHTAEHWIGGPITPATPLHLYLQVRQRGGDANDAPLVVTPIYDGEEQPSQNVAPRSGGSQVFRTRVDVGYEAGAYRAQFMLEQMLTTSDEALLEVEQAHLSGLLEEVAR